MPCERYCYAFGYYAVLGLKEQVNKVLRISLNKYTTEDEVGQLIKILKDEV